MRKFNIVNMRRESPPEVTGEENIGVEDVRSSPNYVGLTPNPPDPFEGMQVETFDGNRRVYIPLIKNIISKRELMWTDKETGLKWENEKNGFYVKEGMKKLLPNPWKYQNKSWEALDKSDMMYMQSGESTFIWLQRVNYSRPPWTEFRSATALGVMTGKRFVFFKNSQTGILMLLRLIDERLPNASGDKDPRVVKYPMSSDVIIGVSSDWWEEWLTNQGAIYSQKNNTDAYLMYRWNVIQDSEIYPQMFVPIPDPYIHDYILFEWIKVDPINPNTFV